MQPVGPSVAQPAGNAVQPDAPAATAVQPVPPAGISSEDRLLLPHDFARGYVDFQMAPPHDEMDMGVCLVDPSAPEFHSACTGYARYEFSAYLEVQPFGRTPLRRLFLIVEPKFFAGDNFPQQHYTYSAAPILTELTLGGGFAFAKRAEFRAITHKVYMMGKYAGPNSVVSWTSDGPYGSYSTVGVRYFFGGYGRSGAVSR
ncbi:MAG: hypothetical protein ACLQBJ_13570 [Bryobacteraceae bacterium]